MNARTLRNVFSFLTLFMVLAIPCVRGNGELRLSERFSWLLEPFLTERKVAISLEEGVGVIDVEDEFENPNPRQIEGIYRFSLPPDGFVASFAMMTDGKTWVPGKIMEIGAARAAYESIVSRQTDPGLLEQHGNELLIKVFPIEATWTVRLRFRIVLFAPADGNSLRLPLPVEISPNPLPKDDYPRPSLPPGESGKTDNSSPTFHLEGEIRDGRGLASVSISPEKGTTIERRGEQIRFTCAPESPPIESPVLIARFTKPSKVEVVGLKNSDSRFTLVRISEFPGAQPISRGSFRILADGSGSMGGKQRERLLRTLDALEAETGGSRVFLIGPGGAVPTDRGRIESHRFFGPTDWGSLIASSTLGRPEPTVLITDGDGLSEALFKALWKAMGRCPLWVVLLSKEIPEDLQGIGSDMGGVFSWFDNGQWATAKERCAEILAEMRGQPRLDPGDRALSLPLFGHLGFRTRSEAFYILRDPGPVQSVMIRGIDGGVMLPLPAPKTWRESRLPLGTLLARQSIRTLAAREQTDEVSAEITRLGLANSLVTEYTAFLAVPADVALIRADALNPAFLGMFGGGFRKAREQARCKACFANMRVMLGALEMYNMDHAQMMDRDPKTLVIDIPRLVKEQYLKTEIQKPSTGCEYYGGPDSLTGTGNIFCALHGYAEGSKVGQYPGVTAENQFRAKCEETGYDPDEFFIDFQLSELDHPDTPLDKWLDKHEFLLELIFLLL